MIITDNSGKYINANLTNIFTQSAMMEQADHNHDLHTSSIMAKEMKGSLKAKVLEADNQVSFIVTIPFETKSSHNVFDELST